MKIKIALGLLSLFLAISSVEGQTKKSGKVRQLERQRKEVQQRIEHTDKKLKDLKRSSNHEERELQLTRERAEQKKQLVGILNNEVGALQYQIDSLGGRLTRLAGREKKLLKQYRLSLRSMQRMDRDTDMLLYLFSASSLEEAVRRQHFMAQYMRSSREVLDSLKVVRRGVESTKQSLGEAQAEKKKLAELRDREKRELEQEAGRRSQQVKKLQQEQGKLEQELKRQQQHAQQLEHRIEQQIALEVKRAAEKARKAQEALEARRRRRAAATKTPPRTRPSKPNPSSAKKSQPAREVEKEEVEPVERKADSRGGYAMDNAERALAGSFRQNKGRLPMPVRGRYQLVYRFGKQPHETLKHIQVVKAGIDLRPLQDKNAYAVFSGTVSSVLVMDGYGTSVILRHGNYLTVYSNLTNVTVRSGQQVRAGQTLGTIAVPRGENQRLLHFQLWYEQRTQDPWPWLKK